MTTVVLWRQRRKTRKTERRRRGEAGLVHQQHNKIYWTKDASNSRQITGKNLISESKLLFKLKKQTKTKRHMMLSLVGVFLLQESAQVWVIPELEGLSNIGFNVWVKVWLQTKIQHHVTRLLPQSPSTCWIQFLLPIKHNKNYLALSSLSKKQFWRTILAVQRQGSTHLNSFDPIQIKATYPIYI